MGHTFRLGYLLPLIAALVAIAILQVRTPVAHAGSATLNWAPPTTNSDGSPLTDLAGYKLYVGTSSGSYQPGVDIGNRARYTLTGLTDGGTYYVAVSAYNADGVESALSSEAATTVAPASYVITASAGSGGSITALNNANTSSASNGSTAITSTTVAAGASQGFAIAPASGYALASLTVDGAAVPIVASYTFPSVNANHTIAATFAAATATPVGAAAPRPSGGGAPIFAVNSGGAQYTSSSGVSYRGNTGYSGGTSASAGSSVAISGTADQTLYQSERYGNFSYSVPAANGSYLVTLNFAETYWSGAGQRVFNVSANGQTVISNLDIYAKAGKNAAYDVTVPVTVTNGTLALNFITVVDNAKVSAISVRPVSVLFADNAGGGSYLASDGTSYAADGNFSGGASAGTTAAISGTADQALYQSERYGNFSYSIPAANGSYAVTLKFAETYWNGAGQRVFNVSANGQTVISNLDIYAKVGKNAAYDVTVPVTVTNGTLTLTFTTVVDNAKVSAISVRPSTVVFAGHAGGGSYLGSDGVSYAADSNYSGGASASNPAAISGTVDQALYQSERYGNFSYNIPAANGNYAVTMKFSENYWSAAGQRVFSVGINGGTVLGNLDIFAKVGKNAAYDVTVPVSVTNGALNINFTTQVDNAKVDAIVVRTN